MRKRTETRLVDKMVSAYVDRREASRLVHYAYRSRARATGPRARVPFWRYTAELDATARTAEVYSSRVRRVGHPATSNGDPSRPLAA